MMRRSSEHDLPDVLKQRIYEVVRQVPYGLVSTYGDIALIVGGGIEARTVGQALNALPKHAAQAVPWQRIVNAQGGISTRGLQQRALLEAEGVVFDARGLIDLRRYRWPGPDATWAAVHGYQTLPLRAASDAEQLPLF